MSPAVVVAVGALMATGCGSAERHERTTVRPAPRAESDEPPSAPIHRVAAGLKGSCALTPRGVHCWGEGNEPPVLLEAAAPPVDVSASGRRVCVLFSDETVRCASPFPGALGPAMGEGLRVVGVGPEHVCAAGTGLGVTCWGSAGFGRLGTGAGTDEGRVEELADVVELALGDVHSCALTRDGSVYCWGLGADAGARCAVDDDGGVACEGTTAGAFERARRVDGLTGVRSIAADGHRTCALRADGVVECFGMIRHDSEGRFRRRRVAEVRRAERLTLGATLGCVLADGHVYCWGEDDRGQRGDGVGVMGPREISAVQGLSDAVDVEAGAAHACAARATGEILCWGANDRHQLGDGSAGFDGTPAVLAIPGLDDLQGSGRLLCARLEDGAVECLGRNDRGQLGDGTLVSHWDFSPVVNLSHVVHLDVAVDHACAVDRRGELRCWGDNRRLHLGPSGRPDPPRLSAPVRATWLRGIAEVATSFAGTCARARNGRVSCFGRRVGPRREPTTGPVPGLGRARDLDGSWQHSCAVVRGGRVRCWGVGAAGQLGVAAETAAASDRSHLVDGIAGARSVATGCSFSCALRAGGRVWCWGELPGFDASAAPFAIDGIDDAVRLEAGCSHACVRTRSGAVACWGGNERGQLGTGRISFAERLAHPSARGALHVLDHATCIDQGGGALSCHGEIPGVAERADRPVPVNVSLTAPD